MHDDTGLEPESNYHNQRIIDKFKAFEGKIFFTDILN